MLITTYITSGGKIARVVDGKDTMDWVLLDGSYIKITAYVNGQHYKNRSGVWVKSGRGALKKGSVEKLRAMERFFRNA